MRNLVEVILLCCDIVSLGICIGIKHNTLFPSMDAMLHVSVSEDRHDGQQSPC